jgi:hypothetical protein
MTNDDNRPFDENDWTAEERARFATLSAHRIPPAELKQRTVRALRERGYLARRGPSTGLVVGGLVAAAAVFAAGALVGYSAAERRSPAIAAPAALVSFSTNRAVTLDSSAKTVPITRHVVWY